MTSSPMSWALVATALFFFFFAVFHLWRSARAPEGAEVQERLGCGFAVVALAVWAFAFARILGSFVDGARLALGLVLFLPVVRAIARPTGAKILRSALALFVGVLLAGPVVVGLVGRLDRSEEDVVLDEMEARVEEIRSSLVGLDQDLARLEKEREGLRAELAASAPADFDSLDDDALARLRQLAELDHVLATTRARSAELRETLPRLEEDLARLRRDASLATPTLSGPELESMRNRLSEPPPKAGGPVSVEDFVERDKLRELYEADVRGDGR